MLDTAHQVGCEQSEKFPAPTSLRHTGEKVGNWRFVHLDIIKLDTQTHRRAGGGLNHCVISV